jgi:NAD(P)-dependent dehydrogenase (short-subunit alcohol dehydrogenase family)
MENKGSKKVWLITGCSSGFGKELVTQLSAKGEQVIATARNIDSLKYTDAANVLKLKLDVTNAADIKNVVDTSIAKFGRIDVLINNAGYGQGGALEEVSDEAIRAQFETNVFGVINLTKAVLPHMRKQGSGTIQVLSSIAGLISSAGFGIYNASKFALEGLFEAVAAEVAHLNIKVTLIEPGPFRTEFLGGSIKVAESIEDYQSGTVGTTRNYIASMSNKQAGNPVKAAEFMIEVAEAEKAPLRLLLGRSAWERYQNKLNNELKNLEAGKHYALDADFADPSK